MFLLTALKGGALALLLALTVTPVPAPPTQQTSLPSQALRVAERLTVIVNESFQVSDGGDDGPTHELGHCTGVAVRQGRSPLELVVLTAKHCAVAHDETQGDGGVLTVAPHPVSAQFMDGDTGRFIGAVTPTPYPHDDAALLVFHFAHRHTIALPPPAPMRRGEPLFVFGNPEFNYWVWQRAYSSAGDTAVRTDQYEDNWYNAQLLECPACEPGDSGAGVWNAQGQLVGLFVATMDSYGLAIPDGRLFPGGSH